MRKIKGPKLSTVHPPIRHNKKPRRLVPRGWTLDGCILEKLNKIPKGLSTEYKEARKAWAQYVQDKTQYVQDKACSEMKFLSFAPFEKNEDFLSKMLTFSRLKSES